MARRDRETVDAGLDSILPAPDLMGDIIAHDRQRSGRSQETPAIEGEGLPPDEDMKLTSFETGFIASNEGRKPQRKKAAKEASREGGKAGSFLHWREDVLDRARECVGEGRRIRMNVDIDKDLHLRMKMWCLANDRKFNEIIPALMAAFLDNENA